MCNDVRVLGIRIIVRYFFGIMNILGFKIWNDMVTLFLKNFISHFINGVYQSKQVKSH